MSSKSNLKIATRRVSAKRAIWIISVITVFIKLVLISIIENGAWLGADGESYINGVYSLITEGYFSSAAVLHYWPAGYSLTMLSMHSLSPTATLATLSIFQSIFYSFSTGYLGYQLRRTSLKTFAIPTVALISINPTLTLSSLVVGYESLSASCLILAIALFISNSQSRIKKFYSWQIILAAIVLSINCFVQPRFILSSILIFFLWGIFLLSKRMTALVTVLGVSLSLILPMTLVYRNSQANGFATISTNLGTTMQIGAGKGASGAYNPTFGGVDCPSVAGNPAEVDRALVSCVLNWYTSNPAESLRLFLNKSLFLWSPWFGSLATGSMARNPGNLFNPAYWIANYSQDGRDMVYGVLGQVLSVIWMSITLFLLVIGLIRLWSIDKLARQVGILLASILIANWLISLGTLGDHRQRLPIQGLILFVQAISLKLSFSKFRTWQNNHKSK